MPDAIVLVKADDPTKKPQLFACPKCGRCQSPRIYACTDEMALQVAREAAENCYECREHNICQHCGEPCEKYYTACRKCRRQKRLDKAEKIPASEVGECFAFDGDGFYHSVKDALEAGETIVHPADFRHFSIEPECLVEMILEGHHEDASRSDLVGLDDLLDAIERFNKAQTSGSFDPDYSRVAETTA